MAKMGRPRKEINKTEFEKLCFLQCTQQEIADWFVCSPDTIERWCQREYNKRFAEVFAQNRGKGKISLRRMQWQLAEKSPAMAIFLGKNLLGQTDKVEQTQNINGAVPTVQVYLPDNGRDKSDKRGDA